MKCIYCNNDAKYKDRSDGKCPSCGKLFALEPQKGDVFTDGFVKAAVDAVSAEGKVRWNLEHLYFEMWRRFQKKNAGCSTGCSVIPFVFTLVFGHSDPGAIAGGALLSGVLFGLGWLANRRGPTPLKRDVFNLVWSKWANVHGVPASMIVPKPQPRRTIPESDLGDYSFDRAVICDTAATVDLLLANNFHFENNCAILSVTGYPEPVFETVRKMLKRNQNLRVWVLHDCTPEGCTLAARLKSDPDWFPTGAHIIDVGLRPVHAPPLKKMLEPGAGAVAFHEGLTTQERDWLAKHKLALAAIRPEQVIKRLFRSFTAYGAGAEADGFLFISDTSSFGSDASTSDGGGDSFG